MERKNDPIYLLMEFHPNDNQRYLYRPVSDPRTGNDPQIGPQMIPHRLTINMKWNGLKFGQWISTL